MIVTFWIVIGLFVYHLLGYGLVLKIFTSKGKSLKKSQYIDYPSATMVCPAYNEEDGIEAKLESFLQVDYPKDKLQLIVVSDDSTDRTNEIVSKYTRKHENIKLVVNRSRAGKPTAQNLVEPLINSEVVFLSDATSVLAPDALKKLVDNFQDPEVGLVASRLIYVGSDTGKSSGEGVYWKYESWLRQLESKFYSITVASGALFALRRDLFTQVHPSSPDDFERTLIVMEKGYKAKFENSSEIREVLEETNKSEIRRKIRVISREWFALMRHASLLNPFKFPQSCFSLFSHKLIRWLIPHFSITLLIVNFNLLDIPLYAFTFAMHLFLLIAGTVGLALENTNTPIKILKIPTYWIAMNYAALIAFVKFIFGKQQRTWETGKPL